MKQIFFLLSIFYFVYASEVFIDTKRVLRHVDSRFLSVAIDSGVIRRHWEHFQPKLVYVTLTSYIFMYLCRL